MATSPTDASATLAPIEVPAIEVVDLAKRYRETEAVRGISFAVRPGETLALLGGNGAGKTTTIAMIMGLVTPTAGTARVLGWDMARERHRALHRVNFQSPYVEMPHRLTVRQNLAVFAGLYGVARALERIEALAADLDLSAFLDRPAGQLSAGQKTRVALAKALVNTPDVLLLDEPTASLDPDTADWVRSHLEAYARTQGAAILLASHNMPEVERLAARVVMLKAGRIEDEGSPADLIARYGRSNLEEVFLDIARGRNGAEAA